MRSPLQSLLDAAVLARVAAKSAAPSDEVWEVGDSTIVLDDDVEPGSHLLAGATFTKINPD